MAIANLNAGGVGGGRPPVGAFFGKPVAANDNMQKISSNFISKDVVGSVLDSISGISAELKKIQQFSKDAIKSFERLVVDMRKLNNDITSKFKSANSQIKKDNMDFLRSITTRPSREGLQSIGETNAPGVAGKEAGAAAAAAPEENKSFLDSMLDLANLADNAKDALDLAKKYGPRIARAGLNAGRAVLGSAALLPTVLAGGLIALAYNRKQEQEANPEGAAKFDRSIASGSKRAEVIQGGNDANAPNANADISRPVKAIPDFLKDKGIIPTSAMTEVAKVIDKDKTKGQTIVLKDGRYFDASEQILKNPDGSLAPDGPLAGNNVDQGKPAAVKPADTNLQGTTKTSRIAGEDVQQGSPLSDKQMMAIESGISMGNIKLPDWIMEQYKKQKSVGKLSTVPTEVAAASTEVDILRQMSVQEKQVAPASDVEKGTPIKVADIPASTPPADVPAEGNTSASVQAGTPTPAAAPVAAAAATPGTPAQVEEDFSNLANVSGVQVEKDKDIPDKAMMALDAMMENDPEAVAKKYPAWVLEQYAKQNGKEGSPAGGAGDQTTPELGGGAGGTPDAEGGGSGGGATGGPEGETGAPAGAPEAAPAAPPSVPSDLVPPSQQNQDTTPIVMNNNSSSTSGSVTNSETNASSGQNLPMTAQNDALSEYFAKQNVEYQ